MGLFQYSFAGGGFLLIGAWESYVAATEASRSPATGALPQPPEPGTKSAGLSSSSAVTFLAVSVLSFLFIVNSVISISEAIAAKDPTGLALQLEVIAISLLFFLYSVLGFVTCTTRALQLPRQILNLISLFAFAEEFLLFYLQRKDPSGVENRYYNLFLVPISICAFSTILELKTPKSNYPRLGLGVGLILQGIWFLQMGFSFFTGMIAHGCSLHKRSRGNYTIKCDGHPAYHRGGAIATLQFNCHLALLVVLVSGVYSVVCRMNGIEGEASRYRPLGVGVQQLEMGGGSSHFTLDSDEDDEDDGGFIKKEEKNLEMQEMIQVTNGYHTHG
ncbi:unnamed protein product [Cuscuta campestris]|uniref:Uncharacterized protein n=1 Tax=Cuscuta campestris TaxID=132261 RepID=A0A484KMV7_9ASTE|nr:unnamed protein product [Cuscuta campestris]